MAPKTRAVLSVRPRSLATRATSGKLTITLIAEAMTAPLLATCDGRVPAATRFAAEATALALDTTPPTALTVLVFAPWHASPESSMTEQRQWVAARAQLVYLAREWSGITTKELGRRLHRDASMISRLYSWYQGHRNKRTEERLARELAK
jgi:hypothetical protein